MKSLFVFAAATAVLLASAALPAASPGRGISHQTGQASDRLTVGTGDHAVMYTAIHLDNVGQIGCAGRAPVTG